MNRNDAELDDLIENEKRLAAREVQEEAWNDGLLEGIETPLLAEAAIATAIAETVRTEGEDTARAMMDGLRERLEAGEFSPTRTMQ